MSVQPPVIIADDIGSMSAAAAIWPLPMWMLTGGGAAVSVERVRHFHTADRSVHLQWLMTDLLIDKAGACTLTQGYFPLVHSLHLMAESQFKGSIMVSQKDCVWVSAYPNTDRTKLRSDGITVPASWRGNFAGVGWPYLGGAGGDPVAYVNIYSDAIPLDTIKSMAERIVQQ